MRIHVCLMRVLWPRHSQRSGGDCASDQESGGRGKGRQLATSRT